MFVPGDIMLKWPTCLTGVKKKGEIKVTRWLSSGAYKEEGQQQRQVGGGGGGGGGGGEEDDDNDGDDDERG